MVLNAESLIAEMTNTSIFKEMNIERRILHCVLKENFKILRVDRTK